jgi:hypothetical protein
MATPLRLVVYDRTCRGRRALPGLSAAWAAGTRLYGALGRVDAWYGASSWREALDWLADVEPGRAIAEVQFWGHGRWGRALVAQEALDEAALAPHHPLGERLRRVRARLVPGGEALWWFRTCETFGGAEGQRFARAFSRLLGCRAAGHTHVIGVVQSGLHTIAPGEEPGWAVDEGLRPDRSGAALRSRLAAPNTITCFHGRIPAGF